MIENVAELPPECKHSQPKTKKYIQGVISQAMQSVCNAGDKGQIEQFQIFYSSLIRYFHCDSVTIAQV